MTNVMTRRKPTAALVTSTNRMPSWKPIITSVILAALAIGITFIRPDFELIYLAKAVAYAVAILGLNIVIGFSGQFSLAQGAFVGIGAYTAAILVADYGWPILATIPVAALLGFGFGFLLGLPALRVKGFYLATMTLGVAIVFPLVIKRYDDLTGGASGKLALVDFDSPVSFLSTTQWRFLVICFIAGLCFIFVRNVIRSRIGRAMAMIRSNETAALSNGIPVPQQRVLAFAWAGLFGAVAGPLLVMVLEIAGPDDYGLLFTILITTGLIIGGTTRLMGALLGGLVIALLPSLSAAVVSGPQASILYALLLVIMIFLLPGGLASLPSVAAGWWKKWRGRRTIASSADEGESATPETTSTPESKNQ